MQSRSRLVFEEKNLRIPGVHSLGQYHYATAKPGLPPHQHPGCVEISLLAKGCQSYRNGGNIYHVKGGEQYISLPGEIHDTASEPEEKGVLYWLILDVTRQPDKFLFLAPRMAGKLVGDLRRLSSYHFSSDAESRATLDKAFRALGQIKTPDEHTGIFQDEHRILPSALEAGKSIPARLDDSFHLLEAVSHLLYYILQTIHASRANVRRVSPAIQASLDFISKNENEWLDVAQVAKEIHLSESHFKIRFRQEVGLPPAEYMLHQKIAAAKVQLSQPSSSVTDVAYSLGFSSSQYFATVFKRFTNLTPSEFHQGRRPEMTAIFG